MIKPFIITSLLCASTSICAQTANRDIDSLVDVVVSNNGKQRALQAQNEAELQNLRNENNFSDPEIGVIQAWGEGESGNKFEVSISQGFEWPGVYSSRRRAVQAQEIALSHLSCAELYALRLDIKQAMIDIVNCHKRIELYSAALNQIDSLAAIVARDVEKKEVSILDGNKLKIERIAVARSLKEATADYDAACVKLTELNNGTNGLSDIVEQLTDYPDNYLLKSSTDYVNQAKSNNPSIAYQNSLREALLAKKDAAKKEGYPGFNLGIMRQVEAGEKFNGFSVSMTLPFFSYKGKTKAVDYEIQASEIESKLQDITIEADILASHSKAANLLEQINEYGSALDCSSIFSLLRKAFEARHITVMEYIADFTYFTNAQNDYLDLIYQYQTEVAKLEQYSN